MLLMSYKEKGPEAFDLRFVQCKYSKVDDDLVWEYVKRQGVSNETFKLCAERLGRVDWNNVKGRHELLMSKGGKDEISYGSKRIKLEQNKRRKYTEEEDQIILTHAKTNGDNPEAWKACAENLDRERWENVRNRYMLLRGNGGDGWTKWQLFDDEKFLDFIFKVSLNKICILENGGF